MLGASFVFSLLFSLRARPAATSTLSALDATKEQHLRQRDRSKSMESSSNGQRHVGTSTANKMERKALLRQLALQEASRRSSSAGATAEGSSEVELGSDEDQKALLELLEEERQRNDNEWKIVREELAKLRYPAVVQSQPEDVSGPSSASRREMKRLQLAKLDFDIASLEEDLQTVPEARTTSTHEVRVRAILADAIAQLEEALHLLRMDVEEETKARIQQRKMLEDLKGVAVGLQLRKERIEAKAKNMDVDIIVR